MTRRHQTRATDWEVKVALATAIRSGENIPDETLIADARAGLTPSQVVESKLRNLLRASALPVSHVQTAGKFGR